MYIHAWESTTEIKSIKHIHHSQKFSNAPGPTMGKNLSAVIKDLACNF